MTEDRDPTGMSRLLAGLKESGPMPEDLNERIRARLAHEQASRRAAGDAEGTGFWDEMDSGARRPRRSSGRAGRWIFGLAAAAVLAVGVGGVISLSGGEEESRTASDSGAVAPEGAGQGSSTPSEESSSESAGSTEVPAFAITQSGTDYTRESLPQQALRLESDPRAVPALEDESVVDGMGTAAGAGDCLTRLGHPELQPVVIDVAHFEGEPGLLLIAEEMPAGEVRAWAVTTGCEQIWDKSFTLKE